MRQFAKKYGGPAAIVDGVQTYQVGASWQSALSNGGQVGSIIGLFLNGIISERIGYRKTMIGALCLIICFIFLNFFAVSLPLMGRSKCCTAKNSIDLLPLLPRC